MLRLAGVSKRYGLVANGTASGTLILPVTGLLAIAVVVLASSSIATQLIATRKE